MPKTGQKSIIQNWITGVIVAFWFALIMLGVTTLLLVIDIFTQGAPASHDMNMANSVIAYFQSNTLKLFLLIVCLNFLLTAFTKNGTARMNILAYAILLISYVIAVTHPEASPIPGENNDSSIGWLLLPWLIFTVFLNVGYGLIRGRKKS